MTSYGVWTDARFIVSASDGVWEFIPTQEAAELVAAEVHATQACEILVLESTKRWRDRALANGALLPFAKLQWGDVETARLALVLPLCTFFFPFLTR